jgi:hypothetical protein
MHDGKQQQCFKEGAYFCLVKKLGRRQPPGEFKRACAPLPLWRTNKTKRAWQTNLPQTSAALGPARLEKIVRVRHITQEAIARRHGKSKAAEARKSWASK